MLKKLTFDQLEKTRTNIFKNIKNLMNKKKILTFKDFLKYVFKDYNKAYFLEGNEINFIFSKEGDKIILTDMKENIQLELDQTTINKINSKINQNKLINKGAQTILDQLFDKFKNGQLNTIFDKPFVVYDIETIGNINNLKSIKFMMSYAVISNEDHSKNIKYRYIGIDSAKKFTDFILNFDGYIVGYNNIYFDNPVMIYTSGYGKDKLDVLNQKSIDLFLFIWNLTGKRLGLNKVASSLVNVKKTLSSGLEGEKYLKEYIKTGDEKLLSKVKTYCKNDVKMTLGVLLYLLDNKNLFVENKDFEYDIDTFVKLSNVTNQENSSPNTQNGLL